MLEEIHLAYEEILQLEQALIELDEQNTTNTLEIRKREAKVIFMLKQAEEIEEVLTQKENQNHDTEQIREQYDLLLK
jgi:dsDNA-binding SOS-regulon protein